MVKTTETPDWREARRRSAREAIVDAAWELVGEEGLAALSLRDLARRAGITTPTVYAYFESKNAIYDAMFGQAATEFADAVAEPFDSDDPREILVAGARRFSRFCTSDPARYQLLFQRTIPGFEPSPDSYEPAVRALDARRVGSPQRDHRGASPRHVDRAGGRPGQPASLQRARRGTLDTTDRGVDRHVPRPLPAEATLPQAQSRQTRPKEPHHDRHDDRRHNDPRWPTTRRCGFRQRTGPHPGVAPLARRAAWKAPTDCPAWDIRAMYQHVLGACEAGASIRENVHQLRRPAPTADSMAGRSKPRCRQCRYASVPGSALRKSSSGSRRSRPRPCAGGPGPHHPCAITQAGRRRAGARELDARVSHRHHLPS